MTLVASAPAPLTAMPAVPGTRDGPGHYQRVDMTIGRGRRRQIAAGIDARVLDIGLDLDGRAHAVAGPADQVLRERRADGGADAGGAAAADGERRSDDLRLDGRALVRLEGHVTRCTKYAVTHE